jgi:chaperonin GroES
MLNLDTRLKINRDLIQSPNLTDRFTREDLRRIGARVFEGFRADKQSRRDWERRTANAMDLALQLQKEKTFPWPNCSNVVFPLVTIAVLSFHSRAYPSLIQAPDVVKCRIQGPDPTGQKASLADRVGRHMSWQVLEEDASWEEQHDRLLINLPTVGTAFIKTYYSGALQHNVSELTLAQDLVVHYYAKSLEAAQRKTHIIPLTRNEIYERVKRDVFADVLESAWYNGLPQSITYDAQRDIRKGEHPPMPDQDTPFRTLEQHCWFDFDQDGYAEPYIITIEEGSQEVLRIVARFDDEGAVVRNMRREIISIRPTEYFTKYSFIPSPDGGIYDIGFGVLLGPLNESVNSTINMLLDAGVMHTTGGGFLGRGAKIRGGVYSFAPWEWKRVDSTGDDLRKNIVPREVREPSAVLFQLLDLLINYTNRISSSQDILMGQNPGQNTPAETSRNMIEQGMKIYSGLYKRIWRSMKEEFKKLYMLNAVHLSSKATYGVSGEQVSRQDYLGNPDTVMPVADPYVVSDSSQLMQAQAIKQAAMMTPGYDLEAVERKYLRALKVDDIDLLFKGRDKVPPLPNPKVQAEQIKLQAKEMQIKAQLQLRVLDLQEERRVNNARIAQLEAQALKLINDIGRDNAGQQIAAFDAALGALKTHDESIRKHMELTLKALEKQDEPNQSGVRRVEGQPPNEGDLSGSPAPAGTTAGGLV